MITLFKWITLGAFFALMFAAFPSSEAADIDLQETRCVTTVVRLADGSIRRRADVLREFRKLYPCPATGLTTGACTGWAIDHVIPLAVNGADAVRNLQWLPNTIKSCAGTQCKDRWERKVNVCK